jgi:HKD family nuclease
MARGYMIRQSIHMQRIASEGEIYRGLMQAATSANHNCLVAAVAYATESGCKLVSEGFAERMDQWNRIKKDWLISIDFGLTEPTALEFLADLPNSRVYIPNADQVLGARLRPQAGFHKKMYVFDNSAVQDSMGLFSGSANLTVSGLYLTLSQ